MITARKILEYQKSKLEKAKQIGQLRKEGKTIASKLVKPKMYNELSPNTRNLRKQQTKSLLARQMIKIEEAKKGKTPKRQLQIPKPINKITMSKEGFNHIFNYELISSKFIYSFRRKS